jgi:hypothetical protein
VLLALVSGSALRRRLVEPGPYVGSLVTALIVAPLAAASPSASTAFQLHHGFGRSDGAPLLQELDFLGGQVGMAGGILFVLLAIAVARALRRRADPTRYALAVVAVSTFAVFALSALRHRVEANWPLPAYLPAVVLLATSGGGTGWHRWIRTGMALGGSLVALGYLEMLTPVAPGPEQLIRRGHGWDAVAGRVSRLRTTHSWVAGNTYQDASELAFQLPDHPRVFALNLRSRANQYSVWAGFPAVARPGDDLIFILADRHETPAVIADLRPFFAGVRAADSTGPTAEQPEVPARRIWTLEGWRGQWPEVGTRPPQPGGLNLW